MHVCYRLVYINSQVGYSLPNARGTESSVDSLESRVSLTLYSSCSLIKIGVEVVVCIWERSYPHIFLIRKHEILDISSWHKVAGA